VAPLIVILGLFALLSVSSLLLKGRPLTLGFCGRAATAGMFLFTGVSHFIFTVEMVQMLPEFIPARTVLVYLTGLLELLGAIGLVTPRYRRRAGWALILFLVAVFPANVYAALNQTGMGGHLDGPDYLWIRTPLQLFFIGWIWFFLDRK